MDAQEKYNGWTNRATWLVPLHFNDYFDDFIKEAIEENNGDREKSLESIRDHIEFIVNEIYEQEIEKITNSFINDLIDKDYINYTEIAENLSQDIFKEWYDEKIQETKEQLEELQDATNCEKDSQENIQNIKSCEIELKRLEKEIKQLLKKDKQK